MDPESDPAQHLRILAQIAGHVDKKSFTQGWLKAEDEQELKEFMLRDERCLSLLIQADSYTCAFINQPLKNIPFPEGTLVALLRRVDQTIIPKGNTVFQEGDRLTIIGDPEELKEISRRFTLFNVGQVFDSE